MNGHGCPKCSHNYKVTFEEFKKRSEITHENKYTYIKSEYVNTVKKTKIICPTHGIFEQKPNDHLNGHGCKLCNQSILEKQTKFYLSKYNIKYIPQYNDKWLGRQTIDFFLVDFNIGIECQGIQHFKSINFFGGDDGLKNIKKRDKIKLNKCIEKNISLKYINYDDDIEFKIKQIINNVYKS